MAWFEARVETGKVPASILSEADKGDPVSAEELVVALFSLESCLERALILALQGVIERRFPLLVVVIASSCFSFSVFSLPLWSIVEAADSVGDGVAVVVAGSKVDVVAA